MLGSTEEIKFAATNQDICMMCHFSSECDNNDYLFDTKIKGINARESEGES